MVWLLLCVSISLCHLTPAYAQITDIDGPYLSLKGPAKFQASKSLSLDVVDPDFDDSDWQNVAFPGRFSDYGAASFDQIGVYRIRFTIPDDFGSKRLALAGYINRDFDVYLNGIKIGGLPSLGDNVSSLKIPGLNGIFSVFEIQRDLFNHSSENVLTIRIARAMIIDGHQGVYGGLFGIVDYEKATIAKAKLDQGPFFTGGLLLGINGTLAIFTLAVFVFFGIRDRAVSWFAVFTVSLFLIDLIFSKWIIDAGLLNVWQTRFGVLMISVCIMANLYFAAALLEIRAGLFGKIIAASGFIALSPYYGTYHLPFEIAHAWVVITSFIYVFSFHGSLLWIPAAAFVAIRRGNATGWHVLIIYTLMISIPIISEVVFPELFDTLLQQTGVGPGWITKQIFLFSLAALVALRLYDIEKARVVANDRALRAQADERQRVARDMHDTLGQWLGSVKMRLQMMGAEVLSGERIDEERLSELVGDMDILIDDTRRITHDLSPSSVAHKGLFAALREHMNWTCPALFPHPFLV